MRKYEITLLSGEVVLVEAACPSQAIKQIQEQHKCIYFMDIRCVR